MKPTAVVGCVCNLAINILYLQYAALLGACSKVGHIDSPRTFANSWAK